MRIAADTSASPSGPDHSRARFATTAAAAACVHEGGTDLVVAAELMELLGFGWDAEEHDLRAIQDHLSVDPHLPDLLLGTLRDNARAELVLAATGMVPKHAIFIGNALGPASRLRRLVITHAYVGDQGAAAIAEGLCRVPAGPLEEVQVAFAFVGNRGAVLMAAAIRSCRCVKSWSFDGNIIGDEGAEAIVAAAVASKTMYSRFTLSGNPVSEPAAERCRSQLAGVATFSSSRPAKRSQPPTPHDLRQLELLSPADILQFTGA